MFWERFATGSDARGVTRKGRTTSKKTSRGEQPASSGNPQELDNEDDEPTEALKASRRGGQPASGVVKELAASEPRFFK